MHHVTFPRTPPITRILTLGRFTVCRASFPFPLHFRSNIPQELPMSTTSMDLDTSSDLDLGNDDYLVVAADVFAPGCTPPGYQECNSTNTGSGTRPPSPASVLQTPDQPNCHTGGAAVGGAPAKKRRRLVFPCDLTPEDLLFRETRRRLGWDEPSVSCQRSSSRVQRGIQDHYRTVVSTAWSVPGFAINNGAAGLLSSNVDVPSA